MKDFNELSDEEQLDVIRFTTSDDRVFFYSKVEEAKDGVITYTGKNFKVDDNFFQTIISGLERYELYKLTTTRSQAQEIFNKSVDETINKFYADKINILIKGFEEATAGLYHTLEHAAKDIDTSKLSVQDTVDAVVLIKDTLKRNADDLSLSSINKKFQERMEDVSSVKTKFTQDLQPVQQELANLIKSLHEIVKPTK